MPGGFYFQVGPSEAMPSLLLLTVGDEEDDPELSEYETYALSRAEAQALYDALGSWLNP